MDVVDRFAAGSSVLWVGADGGCVDRQPPSRIRFGRHGKPYFQQGPYDNPTRVMRTLDRSVGPGNYHFTTVITTTDEP